MESLKQLISRMQDVGATRLYAKFLAPNDNSKNQVYLGGDFSALNIIPHGSVATDDSEIAGAKRDRAKAAVKFAWLSNDGVHPAPNANLILYPKYPEVRISGFLQGCKQAPSAVMRVRDEGRVMVLGICPDGTVLGFAAPYEHPVAAQLRAMQLHSIGVFLELPLPSQTDNSKVLLLRELRRIYDLHWIASQKLDSNLVKQPYSARNGGGYTLEAELGVAPNGYADPDFLGWEIKQYGVRDFEKFAAKSPVTLFTPEPTGGLYRQEGPESFLRSYGYPDKSGKADRINFGGIYAIGKDYHADTGLRLDVTGYDSENGKIDDLNGYIALRDKDGRSAAEWSFSSILSHWNRKHAKAAYVPSLFQTPPPQYRYAQKVLLCEKTDFLRFVSATASGAVYYDPGIKMEKASSLKPVIKRRSQFRIKHQQLEMMYHQTETVEV